MKKCIFEFVLGIRFFSNVSVLMAFSYNPPYKLVQKLKTREKTPFTPGHYRLFGKQLFLTLDKKTRNTIENLTENMPGKTTQE